MSNIISKFIAFLLLILLLPVLIIVALIIFIDDGFPIIYIQRSYGKNHKPFDLYKFRTMKRNTPKIPTEELKKAEQYLLKSGKFLRKSSIDELPQFFNIIEGKLNFIGPRPCMVENEDIIKNLREKHSIEKIMPGITGWAQVHGRDLNTYKKKVLLDKYYLDNQSIFLDIKIIFKTFLVVLFPKNIKH